MDNYFTSLSLLTHLGVNKILATGVLNKIGYANAQSNTQAAKKKKKKEYCHVNSAHQARKQCTFD